MEDQTQLTPLDPLVDVPPALVTELAVGVGSFEDICQKYGYDKHQIEFLRNNPALQRRVATIESELTKDGYTHEYRSRYVSDVALQVMHQRLLDPATPTSQVVDIYKETVKTGNLLPKQNVAQTVGSGFSITINIPKIDDQPGRTIEAHTEKPILGTTVPSLGMNNALALPEDWDE